MIYKWTIPHITVWGSCFSLGSRRSPPSAAAAPHSSLLITHSLITHSLPHSLTHYSLTHSLSHSLTPLLTHSLTEELRSPLEELRARVGAPGPRLAVVWQVQYQRASGCVSRGRRSTQSLLEELRRAWPPLGRGCLSRGRCSTHSFLAAFRVAGAVHRASWTSCGARGRRWAAAAFLVAGALLEELRRAWPPLGRGCLSRGRRSTQSFLAALRVAGAVHRASWRSCAAAGAAAAFRVAGAVHRASWTSCGGCLWRGRRSTQSLLDELRRAWPPLGPRLPLAWQAQYTEPPGRAAARVAAAGAAGAFGVGRRSTQSPPGRAAARGRRWGRGCLSRGRRSTQGLLEELRRAWPPLGPRLPFAWQAQYTEPPHHLWHTIFLTQICLTPSFRHHPWHTNFDTPSFTPLCPTPSFTHNFVTHHLAQTTLSHTIFHTHFVTHHLSHFLTPSFTHHFVTHYLSPHPLCPTPSFTPHLWHTIFVSTLSHTINTIFHTPSLTHHLSHTTLSHTIFHTPSFTHTFVTHHLWHHIFDTHTPSFTHRHRQFSHTIFHTQLCHTPSDSSLTHLLSHTTLSHTIFHHTIFVTHHLSRRQLCHTPSFLHLFLCLSFLPRPRNKISCSILEEVDLWGYPVLLFSIANCHITRSFEFLNADFRLNPNKSKMFKNWGPPNASGFAKGLWFDHNNSDIWNVVNPMPSAPSQVITMFMAAMFIIFQSW